MPRKMKESGVEWLGQIPEGWGLGRVKNDFVHVKSIAGIGAGSYDRLALTMQGVVKRSKDDTVGLQPQEFESYQVLRPNELVFKLIDLQNVKTSRVGRSSFEGIVSPAYIVLHPRSEQNSKYAEYFFLALWMHEIFQTMGGDAVRSCLTAADLLNIQLPRPSCSEQQRIAAFLDERCAKIDGMIAEAKASIEDYKKWKQSIIFEAVTGKHEKNLKPSGVDWIGAVPEGWKVVKVRQVGKTSSGATPSRGREGEYFEGASIRWVKTLDLNDGVVIETQERITELALADSSCAILPVGTVMVAMYGGSGTIGKCGLLAKPSTTNQAVCSIVLDRSLVDPKYLLWYLVSIKSAWMYYAVGTRKDPNINQEIVAQFRLPLPLLPEQRRIAAFLDVKCAAIDKLVGEKEALIADLEAYKKSLIFETVTGKREVA